MWLKCNYTYHVVESQNIDIDWLMMVRSRVATFATFVFVLYQNLFAHFFNEI